MGSRGQMRRRARMRGQGPDGEQGPKWRATAKMASRGQNGEPRPKWRAKGQTRGRSEGTARERESERGRTGAGGRACWVTSQGGHRVIARGWEVAGLSPSSTKGMGGVPCYRHRADKVRL
eukprot:4909669-Prymnesium_polylepis.1